MRALAIGLLVAAPGAQAACDLVATIGAGYSSNFASVVAARPLQDLPAPDARALPQTPQAGVVEIPGFVGRARLGLACHGVTVYAEHTSSLETSRDRGHDVFGIQIDLVPIVRRHLLRLGAPS
ncbi:MAG: hypothetical protein ACPHN2_04695 [Sinimarinibacterium flocculans]|uniref:hypothetical protein n=1 Tax=Sinimarinibacterium flocculans TaxID=985250 RepID=UPI003C52816F